jgi:hypothetical protein
MHLKRWDYGSVPVGSERLGPRRHKVAAVALQLDSWLLLVVDHPLMLLQVARLLGPIVAAVAGELAYVGMDRVLANTVPFTVLSIPRL